MRALVLTLALLLAAPAWAVEPDEMLSDPEQEARARDISKEVRCLVCRNESIDESSADLARDLRLLVRERIAEGDSDQQVRDYLVARYGEYVLLRPSLSGGNLILWLSGPLLLLLGGGLAYGVLRRPGAPQDGLTAEEQRRIDALMADGDGHT